MRAALQIWMRMGKLMYIFRIIMVLVICASGGCSGKKKQEPKPPLELFIIDCVEAGENTDILETHSSLPKLVIQLKNNSTSHLGILLYNTEIEFRIPGESSGKKPCQIKGTDYGFFIQQESQILYLGSPTAKEVIIGPGMEKYLTLIVLNSNFPFSELSTHDLDEILCRGKLKYKSPCESVDRGYLESEIQWISNIEV